MDKVYGFLILGLLASQATCMNIREKRQIDIGSDSLNDSESTTLSPVVEQCIVSCPVTSEYNPVCGTNQMTYSNPGRLNCEKLCGVNVRLAKQAPCSG